MTCGGIKFVTNDRPAGQADAESHNGGRNFASVSQHAGEFPEFAREIAQECSQKAFSGLTLVSDAAGQQFRCMQSEIVQLIPKIKSAYKKVVALATVPSRAGALNAYSSDLVTEGFLERSENSNVAPLVERAEADDSHSTPWACRYDDASDADFARDLYDFTPARAVPMIGRSERRLKNDSAPQSESRRLPVLLRNLLNENQEASPVLNELAFDGQNTEVQLSTGGYIFFGVPDIECDEASVEQMSSEDLEKLRSELETAHQWFRNYGREGFLSEDSSKDSGKAANDDDDVDNHRSAA